MPMKPRDSEEATMHNEQSKNEMAIQAEKKKIRWYWIMLALYALICWNAASIASQVPFGALMTGALVNAAVIIGFVILLRKSYRRIREHNTQG